MIYDIISTLLIVICVFIIYGEAKKWFIIKKLRHFTSPRQVPILGAAFRFVGKSNDEIINIVFNAFDEVKSTPFQLWLGPKLVIGVSQPEDIQTILKSGDCLNKPYFYDHLKCKSSIIAVDKEIWRPHRRALNTSFNVKMLKQYMPFLNAKSRILVKKTETFLVEPGDLYRTIFICMIDMIIRTTMGAEMNLQTERGASLYQIVKLVMNNIQYRVIRFWLRWDWVWDLTSLGRDEQIHVKNGNMIFDEIYDNELKKLELLKSQGIDYLEEASMKNTTNLLEKCLILEKEGVFSEQNVKDQMRVIVLAGIDTSSITVFGVLLMLAMNQKHQDAVLEELRSVFESVDCDVTPAHLTSMQYLDRVLKESMRLLSPVPFIGRKPSTDIQLRKGTIPQGSIVIINIMHLHRNPKIWGDNVYEFDPNRFLPENVVKRPSFSYIPFSGGARNCIGMNYAMISAKITLAHLLRRYKFYTDLKFEDIRVKTHLVLEVTNENALRIEKRNF